MAPANAPTAPTLDPDQPMPAHSVTTNVTLQLAQPASVMLDARSDLYSAGRPSAEPARGGFLPAKLVLAAGGGYIVVSNATGRIGCAGSSSYGSDGGDCVSPNTELTAAGFVSSIAAPRTLFVSGVFLGDSPSPAPAGLDYNQAALGLSRETYEPKLGQSFFIGDGLTGTGSGSQQRFVVPAGATVLYLGFVDGAYFRGEPGTYDDNTGSIALRVEQRR
jgi:hypothetical protein